MHSVLATVSMMFSLVILQLSKTNTTGPIADLRSVFFSRAAQLSEPYVLQLSRRFAEFTILGRHR